MNRPLPRRLAVLVALGAAVLLAPLGPAAAIPPGGADPDTPGTSASVSPKQVTAGARIAFTVKGYPAGETVYVKIDDGTACDAAAVHGACVYHQQKIPSSGTVSGSFTLPANLAKGAHWLRFLASAPIMKDGQQVGVNGFTTRGASDFTVVGAAGAGAGTTRDSSGSSGTANGSSSGSTGNSGSGTGTSTDGSVAGGVVAVTPGASASTTATTAPTTSAGPSAAADDVTAAAEQTATQDSGSGFPWIGVLGFAGIVVLSFVGTRLATSRRR